MNQEIVVALILAMAFICAANAHKGLYLFLLTGFLQELVRKLMPGQPVYYSLLVGVLVAAIFLGGRLQGWRMTFRPIHDWDGLLRLPMSLFIGLIVVQSLAAFIATNSIVLAGIGLLAYLSPLPMLLIAYYFVIDTQSITRYFQFYLFCVVLMLGGVYLATLGYDWSALKPVGENLRIYISTGKGYIDLPSGFFRVSEVAAWHGAAAVCMLIILSVSRPGKFFKWLAGVAILFVLGAVVLTGRRKMLLEIVMFVPLYWILLAYFQRGLTKLAVPILVLVVLSGLLLTQVNLFSEELITGYKPLLQRSAALEGSAVDRLLGNTVNSFQWVVERNGFFGSGAGTGSQGAQHFAGGAALVGSAAEGGLGKILAELGVPGLILFIFLFYGLARYIWKVLIYVKDGDPVLARIIYGIVAFLAANSVVFMTAHQIYGDLFVLSMLGLLLGIVMAAPLIQSRITIP